MQRLRGSGSSMFRSLAVPQLRRKALNSWSAVQDTYFSTKDIFERHRVVFTIATSLGSLGTAWFGYTLRYLHQSKVEERLKSIENAVSVRVGLLFHYFSLVELSQPKIFGLSDHIDTLSKCFHFLRDTHKNNDLDITLKGLCFSGRLLEAIDILCCTGSQVNPQTYALLLQECIFRKEFKKGKRIHSQMMTVGFDPDEYLKIKLVILYAKGGDLETAHILFDIVRIKSLVSWNTMISGYVQNGLDGLGMNLYYKMRWSGLIPDQFTFASVFRACATQATLEQGKQAHGVMMKRQIRDNVVVNSALIDMYFKCSSPHDGHQVFKKSLQRNVITWTALISGYGQHGRVVEVLESFHKMIDEGFRPNYVTFLAVLSACSHGGLITEGWRYFLSMTKDYGIQPRGKHYAAMVDLLGRAGRLHEAYELVQNSPCEEHAVIWGALLGACRIHGNLELVKLVARKFFELEPENSGKYVVLSNMFATFGLWENVKEVRDMMRVSRVRKDTAYSCIEVQREVHTFLVGDRSHKQAKQINETIKKLTGILKDAGYVSDIRSL